MPIDIRKKTNDNETPDGETIRTGGMQTDRNNISPEAEGEYGRVGGSLTDTTDEPMDEYRRNDSSSSKDNERYDKIIENDER